MSNKGVVDVVTAGVQQLVNDAQRLGITWTLIPATIAPVTGVAGAWPANNTYVIQDNDTDVSRAISLIGRVCSQTRVMIMHVPPQGNYIIGVVGDQVPWPMGVIIRGTRTTNSSVTTSEIGVLRLDNVPVFAGRLYEIAANNIEVDSTVNNDGIRGTIRYTTNGTQADTTSTTLTISQAVQVNAAHGEHISVSGFYVPTDNQLLSIILTVARSTGSGSVSMLAGTGLPGAIDLIVEDHGPDSGNRGILL